MSPLRESYTLEAPADLHAGREAVSCALAWLRVQGHTAALLKQWKLPVTEAVTNAILHGCQGRDEARIAISARVSHTGTEVAVRDPGHYVPAPDAARLHDDPLAEHGRGGFLIAQGTDSFEHRNDASGHTLILRWLTPPVTRTTVAGAAEAEKTISQLLTQLGDAYETTTAYAEFASLLATTNNFEELLARVHRRLAETVEHAVCVLRFFQGEDLVLSLAAPGFPAAIAAGDLGVESSVASTRACVALPNTSELSPRDPLKNAGGPVVVVAVSCPKKRRGTLALVRPDGAAPFTAGQIAFVQAAADFLGTAQSVSEFWGQRAAQVRLEQELQLASKIQQQLLPQTSPGLAGWEITGGCRPSHAMGGDYFDWIVRPDGSCFVLIADVMGKGMPAAMVATILRSTWRALAAQSAGAGELLTALNTQLAPDLSNLEVFITAVLVHLTPHDGRATYANAGHCALLQDRTSRQDFHHHAAGGLPLGIASATQYTATALVVQRGESLFACTDGCYELDHREGAAAGLQRLEAELRAATVSPRTNVVATVLDRLHAHAAGEPPDDCTLVAMRYFG